MKRKVYLLISVISAGLVLGGCGNKQANSSSQNTRSSQVRKKATSSSSQVKSVAKSAFDQVVEDTLKRHKYSGKMTKKDFAVSQIGNQYDVQEKQSGTIVSHYVKKDGKLYYRDAETNKLEEVK